MVAERPDPSPREGPCRLDRLVGEGDVPAHEVGDPDHIVVVPGDDPRESVLVARRRGGDGSAQITLERGVHTRKMPLRHLLMQRATDFGARVAEFWSGRE